MPVPECIPWFPYIYSTPKGIELASFARRKLEVFFHKDRGNIRYVESTSYQVRERQLQNQLAQIDANLRAVGDTGVVGTVLADARYWSEENASGDAAFEYDLLIATQSASGARCFQQIGFSARAYPS